jgi:hypothetical protein
VKMMGNRKRNGKLRSQPILRTSASDYSFEWCQDTSHFLETNQDTESVERFIDHQTKSRRSRSKNVAGLWNRAKHGGKKKVSKGMEPMPPEMEDDKIEEITVAAR